MSAGDDPVEIDIRVQLARKQDYLRRYHQANKDRRREQARARYEANPDKYRAKARKNYHRRPDGKERSLAQTRTWESRNPEKVLWHAAKTRAKRNGLEFNIEIKDVLWPEVCPVLGVRLAKCAGGPGANSPSIDRIDTTRGYVKGNVWVISWQANRMKCNATREELIAFSRAMLDLLK